MSIPFILLTKENHAVDSKLITGERYIIEFCGSSHAKEYGYRSRGQKMGSIMPL